MMYLLLLVGFVGLIKGADFFVDGSSNIAKTLKVPAVIIGLTIVSIGTSLPEAAVSMTASLEGSNELSLSNVTGSNVFNLMVVVGVCVMMRPVLVDRDILVRDFPVAIGGSLLTLAFVLTGGITRLAGAALLAACVFYILWLLKDAKKARDNAEEGEDEVTQKVWKSIIFMVIGVAAIIIGGDLVVKSAVSIAETFGLSETLIGLTIVSVGTSLPELVTSVVAAKKGESDLALGNALGSCIFNIFFILGSAAVLSPIVVSGESIIHVGVMIGTAVVMYILAATGRKVSKKEGFLTLAIYIAYMAYVIQGA